MDKKRIILLSSLLGLAIALLGVQLLVLGGGKGSQPTVAAQPVLTQTAVVTAAPTAEPTAAPTEDPRLMLSFGPVDRDVKELILPSVTEADLSLIRELQELTLLDGRACENGALLHAFSETVSYPVRWTVKLGGVSMDSEITELTVPAAVTSAEEVEAALVDLPQVTTVDLRGSGLDNDGALALREALPQAEILFDVSIQGIKTSTDAKNLELKTEDIRDWDGLAREIGYLPALERITVTGDLTPEQAAYLLEGAGQVPADYSIAFRGRSIRSTDTEVDVSDLPSSELGAIKAVLTVLPKIRRVNLDPKSGSSSWTLDEADQLQ